MPRKMRLGDWIQGIIATVLAGLAMGVLMRVTWRGWDALIEWITQTFQVGQEIEYVLGLTLFILAVMLGIIQLKKFKKKIRLPF
jgi:hypothetical protein